MVDTRPPLPHPDSGAGYNGWPLIINVLTQGAAGAHAQRRAIRERTAGAPGSGRRQRRQQNRR
jgi:hypothetical protein